MPGLIARLHDEVGNVRYNTQCTTLDIQYLYLFFVHSSFDDSTGVASRPTWPRPRVLAGRLLHRRRNGV